MGWEARMLRRPSMFAFEEVGEFNGEVKWSRSEL